MPSICPLFLKIMPSILPSISPFLPPMDNWELVTLLAACRVRTLALRGEPPLPQQMGLEVTAIRRRLSTAAVRAANTTLLARMSQVGEGSGLASKRREWQRREERQMEHSREADWLLHTTGQAIVQRGRIWGK